MIKTVSFIGLICFFLLSITSVSVFGQDSQIHLPLSTSENNNEIVSKKENNGVELNNHNRLQKDKKPDNIQFKQEKFNNDDSENSEKASKSNKNSILKSSSSFVTVFYVLVSYLFSGPLDAPSTYN